MHQSHRSIKTPHHSVKQRHLLQLLFLQQRLHSLQEPQPPQRSHNSLTHREDHLHQGKPSLDAHSEGVRSTAEVRLAFSQAIHQRNRREEQKTQAKKGQRHLAETKKEAGLKLATAAAVHRKIERSAFLRQSDLHARMRGGHSLQQLLDDIRVQPRQPHAGEQARAALLHGAAVPQPLRFQRDGQLAQPAGVSPQAVLAGVIFNCSLSYSPINHASPGKSFSVSSFFSFRLGFSFCSTFSSCSPSFCLYSRLSLPSLSPCRSSNSTVAFSLKAAFSSSEGLL